MTPLEVVKESYRFPDFIEDMPLQIECINELAVCPNSGHWLEQATGKTYVATAVALFLKLTQGMDTLVVMPPLLVTQWERWLQTIRPAFSITAYQGTPAERAKLSLASQFVLVGIQIFKRDFARFKEEYKSRKVYLIVDEATFISNIGTQGHDMLYEFVTSGPMGLRPRALLSGTPINKPGDAYGLLKFTAPGVYRNRKHFDNVHVEERDFYNNPSKWQNLDLLESNLLVNSKRILFKDLYPDAEQPLYIPLPYKLEPAHQKLYKRLADSEMLKLEDGGKIDATTVSRLTHALGQIIVNWDVFSQDESNISAGLDIIEEKLHEAGTGKLVVFAHYRMTIAQIVRRFADVGAVAVNSEVSAAQKQRNIDRFIEDPTCRLFAAQFISAGKGLDGLQRVCNTAVFIEPCQQPRDFHQAVSRLARPGQRLRVKAYMAMAEGTLQFRGFRNLIQNDSLVNEVIRTPGELRKLIFGED